jgi:hypothetical protein
MLTRLAELPWPPSMTSVEFHDTRRKLSGALVSVSESLPAGSVSLRELLARIGEQGLLLVCMFLTLPFLLPVSIPGVSTVFGLAIVLIGIGVTLNRVPWLPARILDRPLSTPLLQQAIARGVRVVARFERFVRPRWLVLTRGGPVNRANGLGLVLAGVLLIVPLGLIPFSNTLPGLAVLLLSLGLLERDGVFIALGYAMNLATIVYFGAIAVGVLLAGQSLLSLVGV